MLQITPITKENESFFLPFLPPDWKNDDRQTVLGSIVDGTACGAFFEDYVDGESILRSIYVAPDYRRRGIGYALMDAGHRIIHCKKTDRTVCRYAIPEEERTPLEGLLRKSGFELGDGEGKIYCARLGDISAIGALSEYKPSPQVCSLGQLSAYALQMLNAQSQKSDILPWVNPSDYDTEISCCIMKDGKPLGCLLVESGKELLLRYLYISPGSDPSSMILLIRYALHHTIQRFGPDTKVWINVLEPEMERLLQKILNNKAEYKESVREAVLDY